MYLFGLVFMLRYSWHTEDPHGDLL